MARSALPVASLALVAALFGCGGGGDPVPTAPPPPPDASFRGVVTATVTGTPAAGVTLRADGQAAQSASDGSFGLDLPAGEHRITLSGSGFVERTTTIRAPNRNARLDLIAEAPPWDFAFYRELVRNGAGGGDLEPLRRWDQEPAFYIDTRPEPTTGDPVPEEAVALVREAIRVTLSLLTDGRLTGENIEAGENPPEDMTEGTVVFRWNAAEVEEEIGVGDAFAYRVGGPANVVVFRHFDETRAVHHEIGHVLGLYHPLGGHRPSHMWFSGELAPPHFTEWDIFHSRILYARPAGNTDPDVDPLR